jgi:hypothetical protein
VNLPAEKQVCGLPIWGLGYLQELLKRYGHSELRSCLLYVPRRLAGLCFAVLLSCIV